MAVTAVPKNLCARSQFAVTATLTSALLLLRWTHVELMMACSGCRLAERVVPPTPAVRAGGTRDEWVLALETKDLLTVTALEAIGFQAKHIVVPNPIRAEVEAIRGTWQGLGF